MTRLLPILFLLICISACSKNGGSPSLVGKWKQTEYYDGRVPAGCLCWAPVNDMSATKIEFKTDGTQQMTPPVYSAVAYCLGNYRIVNDSTLSMSSSCTVTPVETMHWFKKEGNTLTIAYDIPGAYKYKLKFKKVRSF